MTRHTWTAADDAYLRQHYPRTANGAIAAALGVTTDSVYHRARKLGLRKADKGRAWTDDQRDLVRRLYSTHSAAEIAPMLGRSTSAVHDQAQKMGLHKSREWIADRARQSMADPNHGGRKRLFEKGLDPWNKGVKGLQLSPGTQFKPGVRQGRAAQLWQPIGANRTTQDGYLYRKVQETGVSRRDYVAVHHLVWRMHGGTVPPGHAITFKDGNINNLDINNLELITRADLMRRNTVHRWPEEIKAAIRAKASLVRKINQIEKQQELST